MPLFSSEPLSPTRQPLASKSEHYVSPMKTQIIGWFRNNKNKSIPSLAPISKGSKHESSTSITKGSEHEPTTPRSKGSKHSSHHHHKSPKSKKSSSSSKHEKSSSHKHEKSPKRAKSPKPPRSSTRKMKLPSPPESPDPLDSSSCNSFSESLPCPVDFPISPNAIAGSPLKSSSNHLRASSSHSAKSNKSYEKLLEEGYTVGLIEAMEKSNALAPMKVWLIDNSGSMSQQDGHRIIWNQQTREIEYAECSRWEELQQTVKYHAEVAGIARSSTIFRLLNDPGEDVGPQQFGVAGRGRVHIREDVRNVKKYMDKAVPMNNTPLTDALLEIRETISNLAPGLRHNDRKAIVVIATDGLPQDEEGKTSSEVTRKFATTLNSLKDLPVSLVIRLCTDDDEIIEYYNKFDQILDLDMEILDDFTAEAEEVNEANKWLNYGLPLHRMREMGFYSTCFDKLDERLLTKDELYDFCTIVFGEKAMSFLPNPNNDWNAFYNAIEEIQDKEKLQWNPMTKRMEPWINMRQLRKSYDKKKRKGRRLSS